MRRSVEVGVTASEQLPDGSGGKLFVSHWMTHAEDRWINERTWHT
jgi:hypothetical protein